MTWLILDDILEFMNRLPRNPAWMLLGFLLSFAPAVYLYFTYDSVLTNMFQPKGDIVSWLMYLIIGAAGLLSLVLVSVSSPILALYFIGQVRLEEARERLGIGAPATKRIDPAVFLAVGATIAGIAFRYFPADYEKVGLMVGGTLVLYGTVRSLLNIFVPESQL